MGASRVEPLLPRFASVEKVIERLKPGEPVYVLGYCYVTIVVEEAPDAEWGCIKP